MCEVGDATPYLVLIEEFVEYVDELVVEEDDEVVVEGDVEFLGGEVMIEADLKLVGEGVAVEGEWGIQVGDHVSSEFEFLRD